MSETKIKTSQIDYDFSSIPKDGAFHPKNNEELLNIFDNENFGVIDFMNFQDGWDENGYQIEDKDFTFRNLRINSNWAPFSWFEKPLFEFINCSPTFMNCAFNINADLDGVLTVAPLIKCSTDNGNNNSNSLYFMNSGINCSLNNVSDINIIELTDMRLQIENCGFEIYAHDGDVDNISLFGIHVSNQVQGDKGKIGTDIKYSTFDIGNPNDFCSAINYLDDNLDARVNINFSKFNVYADQQGEHYSLVVSNGSEVNINYSDLDAITCIESQETFTSWQVNTTYNVNDLLVWTDPNDSDNKRYIKVLQQFTSGNDMYDIWNQYSNDNIINYYSVNVSGKMSNLFDPNNRIEPHGDGSLQLNNLSVNNNFNANNYWLPINDQNLQADNVQDAITELASRITTIENGNV